MTSSPEHPAVTRFRDYIRIETVQPRPDYPACTAFLRGLGEQAGAKVQVVHSAPERPVVILTFPGRDPSLPSLLLNSHTDVVPVYPAQWSHPPFAAHKDAAGNIYGRGTQDMKCVGLQYLEAVWRMRTAGRTLLRTVHLCFVPDEEIGGLLGMKEFVKMAEFRALNVGFALDEGYANPGAKFYLFYGERSSWWVRVRCRGRPGHGSQFIEDTAGHKLQKVIEQFMAFRGEEEKKLASNPELQLGDVTTVNLTMLEGGVQFNVVPSELCVGFDVRVPPSVDLGEFVARVKGWCEAAGEGVEPEWVLQSHNQHLTCVEDGKDGWWDTFRGACQQEGVELVKSVFPAATDSRYLREVGIPALGFSPMNHTPILLHDHDEFLNEATYLRGIDIYCTIIGALGDRPQ